MATLFIEIDPNLDSQQWRQDLDGQTYTLKFSWNGRDSSWKFELYDSDQVLLASAPLRMGQILFDEYPSGTPAGTFTLVDLTGTGLNPTQENISSDVKLFYRESAT